MTTKQRRVSPSPLADAPGYSKPVSAGGRGARVEAWLDTDKSRGSRRRYHVVLRGQGLGEHDFFSVTPERLKEMAEQLLDVHRQLTAPTVGE